MKRSSLEVSRQAGGVIALVIVSLLLASLAWVGYRALVFYREQVAPVAGEISRVATAVKDLVPKLAPFEITRDPAVVARIVEDVLRVPPPDGYDGAFALTVQFLGQRQMQIAALAPAGVPASDIFEGGRSEIRFNPGPHSIFLVARFDRATPDEVREAIGRMVASDGRTEPLAPVFIEAGNRRIAACRGAVEAYGKRNAVVAVFLDDNRLVYATGPAEGFNDAALRGFLTRLAAAHPANRLLYAHVAPEPSASERNDPCGIPGLRGDFDVVAVSVSRGSTPLDVAIDRSGDNVTREEVVVGTTARPVVLLLMGDQPIVWNVGRTAQARIAGVLAQGASRQAVIGLPKSIPLTTYSPADGPNACPAFRPDGPKGSRFDEADRRVWQLFGRGIGTLLTQSAGGRFVVGEVTGDVLHSRDVTLASVALPDDVLPGGLVGLARLEKANAVRRATAEEVQAWLSGAQTRPGQPVDRIRRELLARPDSVYVVQRDLDLPPGLAGSRSRTFIVPAGIPRPGGDAGHSTFLMMDGFQCFGTGCR